MRSVKVVRQGPILVLAIIGGDISLSLTHDEARMLATLLGAVCDAPPAAEEPAARVSERGEGRGASTGLQEPVMITRIAFPESNLQFDPAESEFVLCVYSATGAWDPTCRYPVGACMPTNPEDDGA